MTYLDTHVVVWLSWGADKLSKAAADQMRQDDLFISPMVLLELEYLRELGRLKVSPDTVLRELGADIDLRVCELPWLTAVQYARGITWTKDPFDRLIVAHAQANEAPIITKDEKIRQHYAQAVW